VARAETDVVIDDADYIAEQKRDLQAILDGFTPDAEHDIAGRPGGPIHAGENIAAFGRGRRLDRFDTVGRRYGEAHAVAESILHATAIGRPVRIEHCGRPVRIRLLHVFDFANGLMTRERAWLDIATLQQQPRQ
jgi:hypothetical protein